jgi:DNA topoisomerase I
MSEQWILRQGSKSRGFRYVSPSGRLLRDRRQLERVEALRIPPAWRDVHIAASPRSAIQAWGIDVKGRKQYRYHERAVQTREQRKYYRVRQLARDLPRIRDALYHELDRQGLTQQRVLAAVVRLISKGFFRVGSERYMKENRTFGAVTLRKRHVRVEGDALTFSYRGKAGVEQRQVVVDRKLARFVQTLLKAPGERLFRYQTDDGEWRDLTERDVNDYLRQLAGVRYSAKDFRTWGGTVRLATVLADLGPPRDEREAKKNVTLAVRLVSAELGNTPTICRASYVHPIVIARYLDQGETIALSRTHRANGGRGEHYPEERALIRFLDRYFPERRKRRREELIVAREGIGNWASGCQVVRRQRAALSGSCLLKPDNLTS